LYLNDNHYLRVEQQNKIPMIKDKQKKSYQATKISQSNSPTLFNLSNLDKKKVDVKFTMEETCNDGGLLLLREMENQIGLIKGIESCIKDDRHPSYVDHSISSMLNQRIMQIAAGYEDANDCNALKNDAIFKICANQHGSLATQPTMSRFENKVNSKELYNIAKVFVDKFISSYKNEPKIIILDPDDTDSTTYGQQELTLFNNYYGDYCFMPLHMYEGFSGKLITTILKPGRRSKSLNVFSILKRIIIYLRNQWPDTLILLRGDSHFCSKEFMDWAHDKKRVEFITGLSGNSVLNQYAKITIESAKREYKMYGKPVKRYHSFQYQAGSWTYPERIVVKVEASNKGTNVRYIVSSLKKVRTKALYEQGYCARGAAELRIKDHKTYLLSDRMSCNSFKANQFRLFLHSAAYVLIHSLQQRVLTGTEFCHVTMKTIQLKIIKIAARIKVMKTKIQIELPAEFYSKSVYEKSLNRFQELQN
jgi:hypothetical protein